MGEWLCIRHRCYISPPCNPSFPPRASDDDDFTSVLLVVYISELFRITPLHASFEWVIDANMPDVSYYINVNVIEENLWCNWIKSNLVQKDYFGLIPPSHDVSNTHYGRASRSQGMSLGHKQEWTDYILLQKIFLHSIAFDCIWLHLVAFNWCAMQYSPLHCIESQGMSLEHKQEWTRFSLYALFGIACDCIRLHLNDACLYCSRTIALHLIARDISGGQKKSRRIKYFHTCMVFLNWIVWHCIFKLKLHSIVVHCTIVL